MIFHHHDTVEYDLIVTDGLWGVGKSALLPIINALSGVQMVRYDYQFENICLLQNMHYLSPDARLSAVKLHLDNLYYSNLIGRHINLRWRDDSGFRNNPRKVETILRMFKGEGDMKLEKGAQEGQSLHLMSHNLISSMEFLTRIYKKKLFVIELVRHPVYLYGHWLAYFSRFDSPRELTLSFKIDDIKVPWFAKDWAENYGDLSNEERSLLGIARSYTELFRILDETEADGLKPLVISFEDLCVNTHHVVDQICSFLNRKPDLDLAKILERNKFPRSKIGDGLGKKIYGYKNTKQITDAEFVTQTLKDIKSACPPWIFDEFSTVVEQYVSRFPNSAFSLS